MRDERLESIFSGKSRRSVDGGRSDSSSVGVGGQLLALIVWMTEEPFDRSTNVAVLSQNTKKTETISSCNDGLRKGESAQSLSALSSLEQS